MQALLEWAGTVAGIAIVAGLLEMLVPSSSMKRYVQLTMGLLVLLTLLGPVLGVLQRTRDLGWETEAVWASSNLSLHAVLDKADEIRQTNRQRQVEVYRSSLEQAAVRAAAAALGGGQAAAQVFLGEPPPDVGPPPVKHVVLVVDPEPLPPDVPSQPSGAPGAMAPVAPVRPVEVNLADRAGGAAVGSPGATRGAAAAAERGGGPSPGKAGASLSPAVVIAVKRAVAETLGLDPELIEVHDKSYEE